MGVHRQLGRDAETESAAGRGARERARESGGEGRARRGGAEGRAWRERRLEGGAGGGARSRGGRPCSCSLPTFPGASGEAAAHQEVLVSWAMLFSLPRRLFWSPQPHRLQYSCACPLLFSTAAHALTNIPWRVPIPQEVASAAATGRILPEGAEVSFDWPTTRSSPNYTLFAFPDKDAYDTCDFSNATQLGGAGSSTPEPPVYAIQGADAAYYYSCNVGTHCVDGLKITLHTNVAPSLLNGAMPSTTVFEDQPRFTPTLTDANNPGDTATFVIAISPRGLRLTLPGALTGTPTNDDAGSRMPTL